jgi:hypothetical protein
MSQLSLYRPSLEIEDVEDDLPRILSFADFAVRRRMRDGLELLTRVRLERANQQCPCCRRVSVAPIELADSARNRNGASIPGTATIVGFRCHACRHEWPVLDRA